MTLPFPVQFYTGTYTTINVSTNGYATFMDLNYARMWVNTWIPNPGPTSDSEGTATRTTPSTHTDDLTVAPRAYGTAYTGVSGSAPNRIFVIEWRGGRRRRADELRHPVRGDHQQDHLRTRTLTTLRQRLQRHRRYRRPQRHPGDRAMFNKPGSLQSGTAVRFTGSPRSCRAASPARRHLPRPRPPRARYSLRMFQPTTRSTCSCAAWPARASSGTSAVAPVSRATRTTTPISAPTTTSPAGSYKIVSELGGL